MSRIGTFERLYKNSVREADDGDILAKWENERGQTVSIQYHNDGPNPSEYWVLCSSDSCAGAAGDELCIPNGQGLNGTYEIALSSARELMYALVQEQLSIEEVTV